MRRALFVVSIGALVATACIESPQERVSYPAVAVPSATHSVVSRGWTITLTRADLAFGPAYFCAAASGSSTSCPTAADELASVARFDGLAARPIDLGRVDGLTGPVRSVSYDLGVSWLDTQTEPTPSREAPDGHSGILEGEAVKGGARVPFVVMLDVLPQYQGQNAIATAEAPAEVTSDDTVLEVHVEPARWLAQVDFDVAAARPERPLVFDLGTVEHNAVLVGLKNLAPPEFRWVAPARPAR